MRKCYIPARSGSKGLPNKNVKPLNGIPLLMYTIQAAIESELFELENIILSTDSKEYSKIVEKIGITVHLRDEALSQDNSTTFDLMKHLLENDDDVDDFVLLQPTSPFRSSHQLKEAWEMYLNSEARSLVALSKLLQTPNLLTTLDSKQRIVDIVGVDKGYSRQRFKGEYLYYPNGSIYISNKKTYLEEKSFYLEDTFAFIMDQYTSVDIDSKFDFDFAEFLINNHVF